MSLPFPLAHFTQHNSLHVHPCIRKFHDFLNDFLKKFIFPYAAYYSIVQAYYIFFSNSSVVKYLGCFQILANINNVALNIGVQSHFCIVFLYSWSIFLKVVLLVIGKLNF